MQLIKLILALVGAMFATSALAQASLDPCAEFNSYVHPEEFVKDELPPSSFAEVDRSKRDRAIGLLGAKNQKRINYSKLKLLLGSDHLSVASKESQYFLIRAKRGAEGGSLTVYFKNHIALVTNSLYMHGNCKKIIDSAIIVAVPRRIDTVIFAIDVAE